MKVNFSYDSKEFIFKLKSHIALSNILRYTFASHLVINQVPLFEIQKLMNHRSVSMTLRYMKLSEANKVSTVEGIY